jgi:hypothetical protein
LLLKDAAQIPASARGYVSVAIEHGLLTVENGYFRAQDAITRAQLAHALVVTWRQVN